MVHHAPPLESAVELDRFYAVPDPWAYDDNSSDARRVAELRALLPRVQYKRVLDIGCGNAYLTSQLPGDHVLGCDVSSEAVHWAEQRVRARPDRDRFEFFRASLFELDSLGLGCFDLVVVTGVLYPQYVGRAYSLVNIIVSSLVRPDGILVSCHIEDWYDHRFPLTRVAQSRYPYREFEHLLEVFIR